MFYLVSIHDPDHSQNVIGSKLGQAASSDFIHEGPISSDIVMQ